MPECEGDAQNDANCKGWRLCPGNQQRDFRVSKFLQWPLHSTVYVLIDKIYFEI